MKNRAENTSRLLLPLILFCFLSIGCSQEQKKIVTPLPVRPAEENRFYDETARYLAGIDLPPDSKLYKLTTTKKYQAYRKQVIASWEKFQGPNLRKITAWREKNLGPGLSDTALYPFSGPDIMNILAFYPDCSKYIMFGLESPGQIPAPYMMNERELDRALTGLKGSLSEILRFNFFITKIMYWRVGKGNFNGIIGVMMFLLTRYGCTVTDVNYVYLDDRGDLHYIKRPVLSGSVVQGCEIKFRTGDSGDVRTAQYFQIDARDISINKKKYFLDFLEKEHKYCTLIKAASYLMHDKRYKQYSFNMMRTVILKSSRMIIQDDTGIPLYCFIKNNWNMEYYGIYTAPIRVFRHRYQKDLFENIKLHSRGPLPFSYGYYLNPGKSLLMIGRYGNNSALVKN